MNKHYAYAFGFFSVMIAWGCSSSGGSSGGTGNTQSRVEAVNGRCPSSPSMLQGSHASGDSCQSWADCEPSCCSCDGSGSYSASACINGKCSSKSTTCNVSESQAECGSAFSSTSSSTSSGSTTSTSASSTSSTSSTSSSGSTTGDFSQCVDGDSYDCEYQADGKWTGTECCVDIALTCVSGDGYNCEYEAKGKWTGTECCVPDVSSCTSGDSYNCEYEAKGKWTGTVCCL